MASKGFEPMVFVDLETTGATAGVDRITEIGIVEVNEEGEVREWSTLLNPGTPIPAFIQKLTGITNDMVATAPTFEAMAEEILTRLHGRLFVAHNARFDYGFLKNEFRRLNLDFKATVLCTVKLSRRLFPQFKKHSLDALIDRYHLQMPARHRALADAAVVWQFWQVIQTVVPAPELDEAVKQLTGHSSWPTHLDPALLQEMPERHGVYLFYGEGELPLYIGKANNLRQRVLSHFSADHRLAKEMSLSQQIRRLTWQETLGEMGALLLEAKLIKQWQPIHNRRLRRSDELCTWRLVPTERDGEPGYVPQLTWARDLDWGRQDSVYGLFGGQREAQNMLRNMAEDARLCQACLGLEKTSKGRPCFAFQLGQCDGACIGQESWAAHSQRLKNLLSDWHVKVWPYGGPVKVREGQGWHVLDAWCYLGSAETEAEIQTLLSQGRPSFDKDSYKIMVGRLQKMQVEPIEVSPLNNSSITPGVVKKRARKRE